MLMKSVPALKTLKQDWGIDPNKEDSTSSEDEKEAAIELKEIRCKIKRTLGLRFFKTNFTFLYYILWLENVLKNNSNRNPFSPVIMV